MGYITAVFVGVVVTVVTNRNLEFTMLTTLRNSTKNRSGEKKASKSKDIVVPNTFVVYRPDLINDLKIQNRYILMGVKLILEKIKSRDLTLIRELLVRVQRMIMGQFMKEQNLLYLYVKTVTKNNPIKQKKIKLVKREMSCVDSTLFMFFNSYLNKELTHKHLAAMQRELYVIGKTLLWSFGRKEKELYSLYTAPQLT